MCTSSAYPLSAGFKTSLSSSLFQPCTHKSSVTCFWRVRQFLWFPQPLSLFISYLTDPTVTKWNRYDQFTNEETGFPEAQWCASKCDVPVTRPGWCKAQLNSRHSPHPSEVLCWGSGNMLDKDILEWGGVNPAFLGHPSPPFGGFNASKCLSLNLPS